MKIAMSGATGFVGSQLRKSLEQDGHEIIGLGRDAFAGAEEALTQRLDGCQAVINLAGEPINRRWTRAYKDRIRTSRVETTGKLLGAMGILERKPAIFISTSAIGAFATCGRYTERDTPNATDFLGQLSHDWEEAAMKAEELGIRTLIFRFGLVLGSGGGLMKQLLFPFKLGLGGPVGDGRQHFSWVHVDDLVAAYRHALANEAMSGVYHLCAPNPVSNLEFTRQLGEVLHRPTLLPVPSLLLKLIYGEGAGVMTSGQCLVSERLPEAGFSFGYPDLRSALKAIVEKARA